MFTYVTSCDDYIMPNPKTSHQGQNDLLWGKLLTVDEQSIGQVDCSPIVNF
jgi:hypothetical protein